MDLLWGRKTNVTVVDGGGDAGVLRDGELDCDVSEVLKLFAEEI